MKYEKVTANQMANEVDSNPTHIEKIVDELLWRVVEKSIPHQRSFQVTVSGKDWDVPENIIRNELSARGFVNISIENLDARLVVLYSSKEIKFSIPEN